MEKIADCYILFHKKIDYEIWDNDVWTPLQVGAAENERILENGATDNEGDCISEWNRLFCETTGTYWIWKHLTGKKYAGQCQYRRRIEFNEDAFKGHDVIAAYPLRLCMSVAQQYALCHNANDLETIKSILFLQHPEYADSWEKYIEKGNILFYSNSFILRTEDFKKYCEWLFPLLFEFKQRMGWNDVEQFSDYIKQQIDAGLRPNNNGKGGTEGAVRYQGEIFGFLSERLWTLYLLHNFDKERIFLTPYIKYENV